MKVMKLYGLLTTGLLMLAAGCLAGPPSGAAAGDAAAEPGADGPAARWLDKLESRGRSLKSFEAEVVFDKQNTLLGDRQIRMGHVAYAAPAPGSASASASEGDEGARFAIDFDRMVVNDALRDRRTVYIFDGAWLVEKNYDRKMFQKRQVVAPGQRFDPLSLDGPFPLPLGQKREAVMSRFDVRVVDEADEAEDGRVHLRLTPREGATAAEGQKEFDQIDLWFSAESGPDQYLPTKIVARQAPEKTTVELRQIVTDKMSDAEMDQRFDTTPPDPGSGWNVDIKPFKP